MLGVNKRLSAAEARSLPPRNCARAGCPNMARIARKLTGLYCSVSCSVTVALHKRHSTRGYASNVPHSFFSTWTPEMAYVLGLIISDGHLWKKFRHWGMALSITDWELLLQVADLWPPTKVRAWRPKTNPKHKQVFSIHVSDPVVCAQIEALGVAVKDKSYVQTLPKVPPDLFWHFLRGYIDGDGGVWISREDDIPYVGWTAASPALLNSICGIVGPQIWSNAKVNVKSISPLSPIQPTVPNHILQYGGGPAVRLFSLIYRDATIYMRRKFELVKRFLGQEVISSMTVLGPTPPKPEWIPVDRRFKVPPPAVGKDLI